MAVAPSRKVTVPVGIPVLLTVAVKMTACPTMDGFAEEPSTVVVGAMFTVWVIAVEVLPENLLSP